MERRLEHTRSLLLDAAEAVFAEKGFMSATLDDIARTVELHEGRHLQALHRQGRPLPGRERSLLAPLLRHLLRGDLRGDRGRGARTRRDRPALALTSDERGAYQAALGHEFTLYLLRNPEARQRVAAKRSEVAQALANFVAEGLDRIGATLSIPPLTFAHVLIATTDAVELASQLDTLDLYRPILEMYVSAIKLPDHEAPATG